MLLINLLSEPPSALLVHDTNDQFISTLKKEMLDNPTSDVQPMLCVVKLDDGQAFHPNLKEGYRYETIGGNHSRIAMQQLLKEHPHLKDNKLYTHHLCSVYREMEFNLTLRLASKHNRAAVFCHEVTTWDKVYVFGCVKPVGKIFAEEGRRGGDGVTV